VEVELKNNRIIHIELLSHTGSSAFERKAINLFDVIMWKNSIQAADGDPETEELLEALRRAIRSAGISPEDLEAAAEYPAAAGPAAEYSADLVIIGAGCAGLCAAIEAKDRGVENVVILEKMSFAGGNTRMSNGCYGAPGSWVQKKTGVPDDTPDRFFKDIYEGAYRTGSPELIRIIADNALADALWLRDEIGVRFRDDLTWYEGHSRVRALRAEGDGNGLVGALLAAAEKRGIPVHYTTRAIRLLRNDAGAVTGAEAERGGKRVLYAARRGVILATGGFGANVAMRQRYDSRWGGLDSSVLTSNSPGTTGDGILMAQEAGAALVDMDYIQLYPVNNPATGNLYLLDYARLNDNALLLNGDGYRFVNERPPGT
jgi:urocanate reductase